MGYDIHIRRDPQLMLSEWKSAVEATESVRLDSSVASITNPITKTVVSVPGADGDAQIDMDGHWTLVFCWRHGEVVFRPCGDFDDPKGMVRRIAKNLAEHLGAQIIGDGGELYE